MFCFILYFSPVTLKNIRDQGQSSLNLGLHTKQIFGYLYNVAYFAYRLILDIGR